MFVWVLPLSILPLLSLAIFACGKKRETAHDKSKKSSKSVKGDKSAASAKSGKSAKSATAKKSEKSKKPGNSQKSKKSTKSKNTAKPGNSAKSAKSSNSKSGKSDISAKKSANDSAKSKNAEITKVEVTVKVEQKASNTQLPVPAPEEKSLNLVAEPQEMNFNAIGGVQTIKIHNKTAEPRVFKVKCSDNQLYRVHPVYQIIEGGQTGQLEVLRQNGAAKMDKLVMASTKTNGKTGAAKDLFTQGASQPQHLLAVALIVEA